LKSFIIAKTKVILTFFFHLFQSCPRGFTGERCSLVDVEEQAKISERSTLRSIIYGFTVTMAVCLLALTGYYLYQNDHLRRIPVLNRFFNKNGSNYSPSSQRAGGNGNGSTSFFRTNFNFNKLDDEQIITQNEHTQDEL
jgi:hypothetical protein